MNILITGAYGFIGSNLSFDLAKKQDNQVIAIDVENHHCSSYVNFYTWHQLQEIDAFSIDIVIHLAGKAHDSAKTSSEQEYFDINVGLTQKIFQFFQRSSATKFIFFSSVKAVADTVAGDELTEDAIPAPITPYGKSKLEAERYILSEPLPGNKKIYILRPCMIHGPGNKGNLNLLYSIVTRGIPYPLGAFENRRSFTSMQNLRCVIDGIIEQDVPPGIYQVADDESLSTNQIIALMAESWNMKEKIWHIPPKVITAFARLGDKLNLTINSERLKKLTESYVVSNKKIKNALDIGRLPVTAEEGMRETFAAFKTKL